MRTLSSILLLALSTTAFAQDATTSILFTHVDVWDGTSEALVRDTSVLIQGNTIAAIGADASAPAGATVIDAKGKTLMPGLIDMHSHLCLQNGMLEGRSNFDQMAMGAMTGAFMLDYLDQGFTTARDVGCNTLGLSKAVRLGRIDGPRLYSAGGWLSQTGGHADTGSFNDRLGDIDDLERHGFGYIVDGRAEMLRAARMNLRAGATQLKLMVGGGVASEFDPIHTTQFSEDEIRAAVEVAADYGTYVTVHAYHDRSVNRAIDAGVRCIEHNFLVSESTIKRMKKQGIALSLQAVMSLEVFADPEQITFFSAEQKVKASAVFEGAERMMKWAVKHDLLMVSGGDMFGTGFGNRQADNIRILPSVGFSNLQALKTATSSAAEVLGWSGGMNPYKNGALGVLAVDAYADVILLDGSPLDSLDMLSRDHVRVVVKDGEIYKNTLD